jgi:transposase
VNVLKLHLQSTVFTLLERKKSQHEIQRLTGIDRKTIRRYEQLYRAQAANSPTPATGSEPVPAANSPGVATGFVQALEQTPPPWPPAPVALADTALEACPAHARSACEPYRVWIEEQVRLKRNAKAIYQDLVDRFNFSARYNSVKRFVRSLRRVQPEQFDRLEFLPGEEAQVDYGQGAPTRDANTGRYRRPRLFVMTLRYSRRSFRCVVRKSSQETWCRLHEHAFRYFGGAVSYAVLDNLKEGVISPDLYEPEINRLYAAMLAHYGVIADPARVRDPNRKGTVENAIQHTQDTALRGRRFESIEEQNTFLMHWEENWASRRIHGSTKRQVQAMFEEEKPHLRALPVQPFRYFTESIRSVWDDTTVRVDNSSYAARPAPIGSTVLVRLYEHSLEIRDHKTQALLRTHPRALHPGSVLLPESERPFNPTRQTAFLLSQAQAIGPRTQALCQRLFDTEGRVGQRSMWGIVGLAKKYPARILEQACTIALAGNVRSSKQVRLIADRVFEQALARLDHAPQAEFALTQSHPLIRPAAEYTEFFNLSARHRADPPPSETE